MIEPRQKEIKHNKKGNRYGDAGEELNKHAFWSARSFE